MSKAYKGAILTAILTSFACMGDTILYSVLPVYADSIGLSDFWLGFLLSINRFVRLISHGFIASFIIRFGLKNVVLFSSIGASLSTFFYKTPTLIFLFTAARIIWGVIRSIGPFLILLIGPFIFNKIGYEKSFLLIGLISTIAVIIAFFLPEIKIQAEKYSYRNVLTLSWFKILLFLIAFIVDGLIIVVLSILFSKQSFSSASLLITVSSYLLIKRMVSFFLPLFFLKSYSLFSITHHFNVGILLTILGLVFLSQELYAIGLVMLFVGATITENVAPLEGLEMSGLQKMEVITTVTLWWDVGKAFGSFVGILMYKKLGGDILFLILSLFLIFVLILNTKDFHIFEK